MRFEHRLTYDASPEDVYAMLCDPVFRERVCESQRAHEWDVAIESAGAAMTVAVDQRRPSDGVPGFARRFVGEEIHIAQRESWSSPAAASLEVTVPHKPAHLRGTIALAEDGRGTLETVAGDLKVSIPLLAGRLEGLIAHMLEVALVVEQTVGTAWLAGDR